ncbi:MAG: cytochrome c family protein [Qipengyuania sp.]|nr:cytochrome c family protein [Qipengyuania sp.]
MDDRFNTAAGWVLFAGIIALGSSIASGLYFRADSPEHTEKMGYFIEGAQEVEGGAPAYDLGTVLAAADPAAGEKLFAKCTACHTVNAGGANGIGPNLNGVLGKPIGKHAAGFAYSADLAGKGGNWDYANMDAWLKSPKAFAAGTKMSFAGLSKPEDRANIMAFLKANGGGPEFPAPKAPDAAAAPAEDEAPAVSKEGETPGGAAAAGATAAETPAASTQGATRNPAPTT